MDSYSQQFNQVGPAALLSLPQCTLLSLSVSELKQLVEGHHEPYLLCWNKSRNQVRVALSQEAGPETVLRAATHGLILGALQEDGPLPGELAQLRHQVQADPKKESWILVRETHQVLDTLFPKFLKGNTPGLTLGSCMGNKGLLPSVLFSLGLFFPYLQDWSSGWSLIVIVYKPSWSQSTYFFLPFSMCYG